MKLFAISLLSILLAVGANAQATRNIDLKVNGVGWNSTYATVTSKLGKPISTKSVRYKASKTCSGEAETLMTLKYSGLTLSLIGDGTGGKLRVYGIDVTDPRWLVSGIRVGADFSGVKGEFGEPRDVTDAEGKTSFLYGGKSEEVEVIVEFTGGKVKKIRLVESLC